MQEEPLEVVTKAPEVPEPARCAHRVMCRRASVPASPKIAKRLSVTRGCIGPKGATKGVRFPERVFQDCVPLLLVSPKSNRSPCNFRISAYSSVHSYMSSGSPSGCIIWSGRSERSIGELDGKQLTIA